MRKSYEGDWPRNACVILGRRLVSPRSSTLVGYKFSQLSKESGNVRSIQFNSDSTRCIIVCWCCLRDGGEEEAHLVL